MKTDGTAEYYVGEDLDYVFKYTWDTKKQEIYMAVEKIAYEDDEEDEDGKKPQSLSYSQILSQINEYTVTECRKELQNKFASWQTQRHQDYGAKTYDEYEKALLEDYGCKSLEEYVNKMKEDEIKFLNTIFGAKITYKYKFNEDDKMVLTEKFSGVKNLLQSVCHYDEDEGETEVYIGFYGASIFYKNNDEFWTGEFGKGNSITFKSDDSNEKKNGSYTESIEKGIVTIIFDNKYYECKFNGINFIEVDD